MSAYYAGLDIGTTMVKAVIFDPRGIQVREAHREYDLDYPRPGWRELDSDVVWGRTREVLREIARWEGSAEIQALSVSVQGEAVTPVSRDGKALHKSIVTFDNRTIPQAQWWGEELGKREIYSITGQPLHPMTTLNKVMWFRDNLPRVFERAWKFLCYEDLFFHHLGLEPTIDHSLASRTMAFDVVKREWSAAMLDTAGIDGDLFAEAVPSGEIVGEIGEEASRETGLPRGMSVVTGGHDQPCSALGGGIVSPNIAVDSTGTVECVTPAMDEPILNDTMLESNFPCYCHVKRGMYVTLAFHFGAGSVLKWYRDTFAREEVRMAENTGGNAYKILDSQASEGPVNVYLLPHFVGTGTPYLDPRSKGALLGLTTSTTRAEIYKAIIDGITYETRLNMERLEECGVRIDELRAIGGGSTSRIWPQIKADILKRKVVSLAVPEAGCLGAAILAATAVGGYPDVDRGVEATIRIAGEFEPDPERSAQYDAHFEIYRGIYDRTRDLSWQIPG
jgi:xylulokinase